MRSVITLVGIILIVFGIVSLAYKGITYTTREKVAEIGNVQLTTEKQKTVMVSPALSGLSIAAGLILVVLGRSTRK